jgi:hypothetical protein
MGTNLFIVISVLGLLAAPVFADEAVPYKVLTWVQSQKTDRNSENYKYSFHPIELVLFGEILGRSPEEALAKYREIIHSKNSAAGAKVNAVIKEIEKRQKSPDLVQPRQDDKAMFDAIEGYLNGGKLVEQTQKSVNQTAHNRVTDPVKNISQTSSMWDRSPKADMLVEKTDHLKPKTSSP